MPMDLDRVEIETIGQAYREKIVGPSGDLFPVPSDRMRRVLEAAFCAVAERIVGRPIRSMSAAERLLIRRYPDRYHRVLFAQPTFYCMRSGRLPEGAAFLKRFARVPGALRRPWNRVAAATQWERWCH